MSAVIEFDEMTFSERLRDLRKASGLTIQEVADKCGLDYEVVHSYLLGRRNPSAANLFKLARCFGVSCESFVECDESKSRQKPKKKEN